VNRDELAKRVLQAAQACDAFLATAESCTAGMLAASLASAPGAAERFHGGVVAYTKPMKQALLGVSSELLARKTAVCPEVAEAMAQGVLQRCPANVAVAITGVAGPEPDEDGNPVGLFYCAVAVRGGTVRSHRLCGSSKDRSVLMDEAARAALQLLLEGCDASVKAAGC